MGPWAPRCRSCSIRRTRASIIPTISTTCRRGPWCGGPRTPTSPGSTARRTGVGATLIEATFPRAYIDANRSLVDLDPSMLADDWPDAVTPSRKTEQGIGLVWRIARGGAPLYDRKLSAAEVQRRIDRWYLPYHAALTAEIDALHRAFGAVWHINCHSMPAVGDANADDPGRERADFVLGDRDGTTCASAFTNRVAETVRGMGYTVAVNDPYKGVELVRRHGRPAEHRHSLQIEIKRTLYMDEDSLEPNAGYARLERDLARLHGGARRFRDRPGGVLTRRSPGFAARRRRP